MKRKGKKRKDYSNFNIIEFLEDQDVDHRFSGKNVGRNWVGFQCPFAKAAESMGEST